MNLEINIQFFQEAASVLPSIFIAFALSSRLLDPGSRRNLRIQFVLLSGRAGLVTLTVVVIGFIAAQLLTLIVLATDTPAFPAFVFVISYVFLFAWFVALQAVSPMLQYAARTAEEEAFGEGAKARVIRRYRMFGNVIIIGSLVCLPAGSVIIYVVSAQG